MTASRQDLGALLALAAEVRQVDLGSVSYEIDPGTMRCEIALDIDSEGTVFLAGEEPMLIAELVANRKQELRIWLQAKSGREELQAMRIGINQPLLGIEDVFDAFSDTNEERTLSAISDLIGIYAVVAPVAGL